jgi:predicted O-linked N-acetylglucosamine transferase (SPINDLY family)
MTQASAAVQQAFNMLQQGQTAGAQQVLQAAIWADPNDASAANMLGVALASQSKFDEAMVWFTEATRLAPDAAGAWGNIGNLHTLKGELEQAATAWKKAVSIDPDEGNCLPKLLSVLYHLDRFMEATRVFLETFPRQRSFSVESLNAGIPGLLTSGQAAEVVASIRHARNLAGPIWHLSRAMMMSMLYWDKPSREEVLREVKECGRQIGMYFPQDYRPLANTPDPERPLKIGYISQDFRNQACGHFLEGFFEHRDRTQFEAHAYFVEGHGGDELTERLRASATSFTEVGTLTDAQVIDRIRADGIDILVDTIVYSTPDKLLAVVRKPAPIIVNYLGYPSTSGLAAFDYRLVDRMTDPEGFEAWSTEKLYRLDRCFMGYTPPHHMIDVVPRDPPGPGRPPVFGSFNKLIKIQPQVVEVWSRVLQAVPGSRLLIKSGPLEHADIRERYLKMFESHGIGADRLDLRAHTSTREEHLKTYGEIDVALDTWPYNGMTTTFEALWMGVPVVAWESDQSHGRVSASILRHTGVPECVAPGLNGYVGVAKDLVSTPARLMRWRKELRGMMRASVADVPAHTRGVEAFYRDIWRQWCASRAAS